MAVADNLSPNAMIALIEHYITTRYGQNTIFGLRDIKKIFYVDDNEALQIISKLFNAEAITAFTSATYAIRKNVTGDIRAAYDKYYSRTPDIAERSSIEKMIELTKNKRKKVLTLKEIKTQVFPNKTIQYVHRVLNRLISSGHIRRAVNREGYELKGKYEILVETFDNTLDLDDLEL